MSDERFGWPSASAMNRLALCPGSWNLSQHAPPQPTSADAESGNRIHKALEIPGFDLDSLTDDEFNTVKTCIALENKLIAETIGQAVGTIRESRMKSQALRVSGKADSVHVNGDTALILDYKTGRGDVEDANKNLQLRTLAALRLLNFGTSQIYVAIIQPWVSPQVSVAKYDWRDLNRAVDEVDAILKAARSEDAPRIPSEKACKYCPAKVICKEAAQVLLEVAEPPTGYAVGITPETHVAALTSENLGLLLKRAKLAESIIEAARDEAKRRLENGEQVDGWQLKDGAEQEEITDPQGVFGEFVKTGGTADQFLKAVKVTKGKLKEQVKAATGKTGRELESQLARILCGFTTKKQKAKTLEESK